MADTDEYPGPPPPPPPMPADPTPEQCIAHVVALYAWRLAVDAFRDAVHAYVSAHGTTTSCG